MKKEFLRFYFVQMGLDRFLMVFVLFMETNNSCESLQLIESYVLQILLEGGKFD